MHDKTKTAETKIAKLGPGIVEWNSLPADRVDFSSFACFKRTVERELILHRFYCVTVSDFYLV